ncbi:dTDP-4-dehydrorhamnose reductase [Beijerinckiaceae bacterium RH AL1]|nr:SDR family oxidoreductase [Beijerinckiaceae bacterium]VVB43622.1 dTDP-4-dehydrorhamnose reductase [Beijerinckiaceae bacterium RH AL8]VVB43638.1 dTDP-4-dehydrorhamnose reductase [Beijerinckiaceae bacterium RH CH11]VVC53928.1 dTDP-4-dehydrorhamnose reductase [Beijerinckiaceae bacterium RH AL1]
MTSAKALVFGASGMIGSQIASALARDGIDVVGFGSRPAAEIAEPASFRYVQVGRQLAEVQRAIEHHAPYDRVVWAHGVNTNDSVYDGDRQKLLSTFEANVVYIAETLHVLLAKALVAPASRFCVVSSIWQTIARQNKLSYSVSKAALQGFIASAAVDLARDGHLINGVLPGVIDTEMTRAMLSPAQIQRVEEATLFGRLPEMSDVVAAACFFCSAANRSITGQFMAVDLGLRNVRLL